jgi:hypothetical protein
LVADAIVGGLEELELDFPRLEGARRKELEQARRALESEGKSRAR